MLGTYDFCGYYELTFQWLENAGGHELVEAYWEDAISHDSQRHARELILPEGFEGMMKYWGHTLAEESPDEGYAFTRKPGLFRGDIRDCPSKGFLLRNGLNQYADYCDHCIGWIGPMMEDAGFVIHHEHNHAGQCWWEFRAADLPSEPSSAGAETPHDVRLLPEWATGDIDVFRNATRSSQKLPPEA